MRRCWCIPPEANAAFVAQMEDVLDVYCQPENPKEPLVCMDEQPVQFLKETRVPVPPGPGQSARVDYEYERNGTGSIFLFVAPLGCRRHVAVTERRTAVHWAHQIRDLVDVHYPEAERIRLVMDQLNTHGIASLYQAFPPEEARRLARKLDIHHTPKHGSWLNIAEIELAALTKQRLNRRVPDQPTMEREVHAWETDRNQQQKGVNWRFKTDDARIKLRRLYPQVIA